MPPAHYRTGRRNAFITACISVWADRDGTGEAADSSTGFDLPDGSNRSPDAAWILKSRLAALSPAEVEDGYLPLCPDFVIELRSKSDRLKALEQKMLEYIANGVRLGWLLDAENRTATICRPGEAPVHLVEPDELRGDPELPGFVLPLARVWA